MNILLVEPTGRNSHYHYVRALFDRLVKRECEILVLTSSEYNHPNYLNHLHRLTDRPLFQWPLIGPLLRAGDRLFKISRNYIIVLLTIRQTHSRIVHFQVLHYLYLPLLWLAKTIVPFTIVYTPHNIGAHYRNKWLQNSLNALLFKLCHRSIDFFVAHTSYHAKELTDIGIAPEKITIIRYAPHMTGPVDLSIRDRHSILFAGSIRRNKGIEHFLQALRLLDRSLKQEKPEIRPTILIAGQSRDVIIASDIEKLKLECLGLKIIFENRFIPADQYHRHFNRAQILVLPYTRDFKSLSAVLLDGYHYDNEIIATDVGANGDIIRQESTGILVEPGDAEAIARQLLRVLKNGPDKAHSRNRRQAIETIYNWDIIADQTFSLYKKIAGRHKTGTDEED